MGHVDLTCPPFPQYRHKPLVTSAAQRVITSCCRSSSVQRLVLEDGSPLGGIVEECNET